MSTSVELNLPEGWVPDGAAVLVIAKQDEEDEGLWESVVPEFSIVGRGDSPEDAYVNALELLADYLMVSADEGRSFNEARRPVSAHIVGLPLLREVLGMWFANRLPGKIVARSHREQRYRVPLGHGGVRELSGVH